MKIKKKRVYFLIGIFLFCLMPLHFSTGQGDWWDEDWSYRTELVLGHFAWNSTAASQPIDIPLRFENPCWAVNETTHSVRVICQGKDEPEELESQLYDLVHSDETHIVSCNLVFLIPAQVDGTERYFVYYDESLTAAVTYPDHVSLETSSYYYEPIPGYPLESHFYQIRQHDSIRYVVAKEGKFLWYTTSQCVTKLKEDSREVAPKNGEAIASFEFVYYYNAKELSEYSSTSQEFTATEILCDGNLMVCFKIISRSTDGNLRTTAVYKYFYNPTSVDRIQVHVVHEALRECQVAEGTNTDGSYASLQCVGIRSASIPDLNFGKIYPFFHFPSEQGTIEEHEVDLFPESTQKSPALWLLQTSDDIDLGKDAWVCFDEGTTGSVHAIVFGSTSVVKSGEDERDGIQLKAYESNYPHFPGLDYILSAVECDRNAYEKDSPVKDTVIPAGFIAEYDAEFLSSPTGGVSLVEREARIFQALVPLKPSINSDESFADGSSAEQYALTVFVHAAPSFPFGSVFSAVTGRRFPYITVEVYRDSTKFFAGTANRLPIRSTMVSSEGSGVKDAVVTVVRLIDFRNLSLFKRCSFEHLEAGRYVIKVFKENPLFGKQRRFIGCTVVDLTKDSSVRLVCQPQGSCVISLVDQQGHNVCDAKVILLKDGLIIAENWTNTDGVALLSAPCNWREPYQLLIHYQGFEVANESVRLRYSRIVVPLKKTIELTQYDWAFTLMDSWGLSPEIDVIPRLTSTAMHTPTVLFPNQTSSDSYRFTNLVAAIYLLQIQYKSFTVEKEIHIPSSDQSIEFPAVYPVSFHVYDSRGMMLDDVIIQLSRREKTLEIPKEESVSPVLLPPGTYGVQVLSKGTVIGKRTVKVLSERSVDLITNQEPIYPLVVVGLVVAFAVACVLVGLLKRIPEYGFFGFIISLLVISLIFPWWELHAVSSDIDFSSTLFLLPNTLITRASTSQVIAGGLTLLPETFALVMMLIVLLTGVIIFLCVFILVLYWRKKPQYRSILMGCSLLLCLCVVGLFIGAMSAFTEVGVGSISGQGPLDVFIPGDEAALSLECQWGPGIGFWIQLLSVLLLGCTLVFQLYQKRKKCRLLF